MIRAGQWLDASMANRIEAVKMLRKSQYVGADAEVIANSMTGTFEFEKGDKRPAPDFNVFFRNYATYPFYSDAIWYLTQMRRWGQITENKPDSWYMDVAKKVYLPEVYLKAANALVAEGKIKTSRLCPRRMASRACRPASSTASTYDGRKPNDYLNKFKIGLKAADKV